MLSKQTIRKCVLGLILGIVTSTMYAVSTTYASQTVIPTMEFYQIPSQFSLNAASLNIDLTNSVLPLKIATNRYKSKPKSIDVSQHVATVISKPLDYIEPTHATSPTISPTPTNSPTPTILPNATPTSSTTSLQNVGGLNPDVLFNMVNSHRLNLSLAAFEKNDQVCSLAASRAPEINSEIAQSRMHAGMYGRNLSYINTENIISMRTEAEAFNWWINDYIHRVAIEGNYRYSCIACSGNACAEEFTNLTPKNAPPVVH